MRDDVCTGFIDCQLEIVDGIFVKTCATCASGINKFSEGSQGFEFRGSANLTADRFVHCQSFFLFTN
jgi:hypothetical protein